MHHWSPAAAASTLGWRTKNKQKRKLHSLFLLYISDHHDDDIIPSHHQLGPFFHLLYIHSFRFFFSSFSVFSRLLNILQVLSLVSLFGMCTHTTCTLLVTNSRDEAEEPGTHSLFKATTRSRRREGEELHRKSWEERRGEAFVRKSNQAKRCSLRFSHFSWCNQIKLTSSKRKSNPKNEKRATFPLWVHCTIYAFLETLSRTFIPRSKHLSFCFVTELFAQFRCDEMLEDVRWCPK